MKIGLVGYQGSGKSTLFEWLTGEAADPAVAHQGQAAMAPVPDPRIEQLIAIFHPKKVTRAAMEIVDTPGLSRTHEGNAARLAIIREAGCLVLVVAAYAGGDAAADVASFEEDLTLADMEIVSGRIERLRESVKKPRPNRDQEIAELTALEAVLAALEAGQPLVDVEMSEDQRRATRSFRLLTEKPKLVVINLADDDGSSPGKLGGDDVPVVAVPLGLQLELSRMSAEEREAFEADLGIESCDRDAVVDAILRRSGQLLYFTAGEKEVRSWMLREGGTALEAADNIHSDLARGFIRAETMHAEDLIRLGSEREVKAQNLLRQEPKDYVVKSGDVLMIRFSV
ncbi:MAG: DUF933 domain-containing protein [Planctomycetales bacterium]|nr:DUF933 domain-containing protein [Planctomycetales bacterium]